jgi:tRNA (guanine-N7-)-methyltransferase
MAPFRGKGSISPSASKAILPDRNEEARRVLYGRRSAGRLRPYRKGLMDELLPAITLSLPAEGRIDPRSAFAGSRDSIWLEIGFGGGEHLAARAGANPEIGMIGVEPFVSGVARMLSEIDRRQLDNVRLLVDDARLLLERLDDDCIERIFVLFPDPWPKLRHHKRRIVNDATLAEMTRALKPGGRLHIATDHRDYGRWILARALRQPNLRWRARSAADWTKRPTDQPSTKYEAKALKAGRPPVFFEFEKSVDNGFCCETP